MPDQTYSKKKLNYLLTLEKFVNYNIILYIYINTLTGHFIRYT